MKKNLYTIMSVLLIALLSTSTVYAGGLKLSGSFSIGSLIFSGFASGLGNTDVTIVIDAIGSNPQISCINGGNNVVPGQSSPKIEVTGFQNLAGNDTARKNGRAPVLTETSDFLPWDVAGCPNSNWYGHLDSASWTQGTLTVYAGINVTSGTPLFVQKFVCDPSKQTGTTASCTFVQ